MKKLLLLALLIVGAVGCDNESNHPYDNSGQPNTGERVDGLLPGLPNLGATCFANASINAMLSSSDIVRFISSPLLKIATDTSAQRDLREKMRTTLKVLYEERKGGKKDLSAELNAYFDAFEAARLSILGSEKVNGVEKLRSDQSDAKDFIQENFTLLGYREGDHVAFVYNVFSPADRRQFGMPETFLQLPVADLDQTKSYPLENLYKNWLGPKRAVGTEQKFNSAGVKADSDEYQVIQEPVRSSLFVQVLRFDYDRTRGKKIKLSTVVTPSNKLEIKSKKKTNLDKEYSHEFRLSAIVTHVGSTDGGHYYAYVYNSSKKRWEKYNDREASVATEDQVNKDSANGYIYLYELKAK